MQKYWKLWHGKRLLAMLLAVTMIAGSLPETTAFAAELPADAVEASADGLATDSSENQTPSDDGDKEPGILDDVQTATGENEEGEDEVTEVLGTQDETDETAEGSDQTAQQTDETQPQADPELKAYSFSVDEYLRRYSKVSYSGVKLADNYSYPWSSYQYYVTVDGTALAYSGLTYEAKWQVKKDGQFTDMPAGESPLNVGEYQLHIVIPAVEGVSKEAAYDIPVEITIAEAELTVNLEQVRPGSQIKDIKIASAYAYTSDYNRTFSYNATAADSELAITLKVKDPYTNAELPGETKLLATADYIVTAEPALTERVTDRDNYKLTAVTFPLSMTGTISSEVSVTLVGKWAENGKITKTYSSNAIDAPIPTTDYIVQVQQRGVTGEDGKPVQIEAAADRFIYEWYDDNYEKMAAAPVDAGTYYYHITYLGESGIYDSSSADITVEIEPEKLTLVPKWKENAPTLYLGMTESDILSALDYDIKNAVGTVLTEKDGIDRDHMWGTMNYASATMPYEPVFKVQIERTEDDVTDYVDNNGSTLAAQAKYRVIFSGYKAVYYASGTPYNRISINTGNETGNYAVDVSDEVLKQNVLLITTAAGSEAEIDVTAILQDGKGATLENPIRSTYSAKQIYEKRAEYKKAKVTGDGKTLAENADKKLTYTWYRQNGTNADGTPKWSSATYVNSPSDAGTYKLTVSYKDPQNQYHAAAKDVYYVIDKQKVKVVPKSAPNALTETSVSDYIWDSEFEYEIVTADGTKLSWDEEDYYINWTVMKESDTEYVTAYYDTFTKDVKYRLEVSELELQVYSLYNNYVDYEETVTGEGESAVTKTTYLHETLPITLDVMGTEEIQIKVDPTKLGEKTKEYNGEAVSLATELKNGLVSVVKKSDGTAVTDIELAYRWYSEADYEYVSAPVNGGSYTLYARFDGDTSYKRADEVEVASITITPKTLTVTAVAREPVAAGAYYYQVYDASQYQFGGVVEKDKQAFTYQYYYNDYNGDYRYGFPAFNYLTTEVMDAKGNTVYDRLRGGVTYTLTPDMELTDFYSRNYKATVGETVSFTTVRGNSKVRAVADSGIEYTAAVDTIDGMTHTIKPTAGIRYGTDIYLDGETKEGNYIALRIDLPEEYADDYNAAMRSASYRGSITGEKAKGYVLSTSNYSGYITVAFDASAKDKKEFDIRWEEGYIEHYVVDFTDAVLLEDLSKAVEPKSIAFNAPDKKMVVGGTQQLDVKLTKKLQSDIIRLQYKTATEEEKEYLSVNPNTGFVTALKAGKANVIAYPVRWEGGQFIQIPGAPEAKLAITITEVTAPKIQKVQTWGTYAGVTYGQVGDGFRREIYVLEGKNVTIKTFEDKIASMRNEQWRGIFAIAPVYRSSEWTIKKNAYQSLSTLEPETDYTVYVRNVSGIRTLSDGGRVVASASGNVKSFKTTKLQVEKLEAYCEESQPVEPVYDEYEGDFSRYEVELLTGSIQVSARGLFALSAQKDLAADATDYDYYPLPLAANLKNVYFAPKLVYQVAERTYAYSDKAYDWDDEYYYVPTTRAKITNAGKLQLKEAGYVYVRVYDSISGVSSTWVPIRITVDPKSIVGKKVQLQVGQSVSLSALVDYKDAKNKVIKGSFTRVVTATPETRRKIEADEHFVLSGSTITAVRPGGNLEGLQLTDQNVAGEATASVKSTTLAPVTGLKTTEITDKYADLWFQHTGYGNQFRIEVVDGRGRTMESTIQSEASLRKYDEKGKIYYAYRVSGLTQQSSYTVKITAMYVTTGVSEAATKVATKSFKSTKMPASYKGLAANSYGGIDIYVTSLLAGSRIGSAYLSSGNTYTLIAAGEQTSLNEGAKAAVTDTLTWTSSNGKVATVKANAGTYTATLKAVRTGSTTIEVKSKITKQVIARYNIYVYAVEDGYSYYGENEPLRAISVSSSTPTGGEVFTQDVSANSGSVRYSFTASRTGRYYFWSTGDYDTYGTLYDSSESWLKDNDDDGLGIGNIDNNFSFYYDLTAGETVYISVRNYSEENSFSCTLHVSMTNPAN
ncbi:MAG: Ig-like domain-containing protein [Eubacterium sp.]|nr:Ig-like domain-containing protein [Eubacterium sp.]